MSKAAAPPFGPAVDWRVRARSEHGVELASRHFAAAVEFLAPDLVRFRIAPVGDPLRPPSWAVVREAWSRDPALIRLRRDRIELASPEAAFGLHLATGGWRLHDRHGLELFSALPRRTGYHRAAPEMALQLAPREVLLGLGETTGPLNKRGLIRELWNIDMLAHSPTMHAGLRSLYVSVPFLISLREGRAAALFWDNPARQTWDLGCTHQNELRLSADSGAIDLYLFLGPTLPGILARYTELTGHAPMLPRWALGYQQSRHSYGSLGELQQVAREFRRRRIPCDVLYLDIGHTDGYRVFSFNRRFPQPHRWLARLRSQGFKVVTIVDPGVKDDPRFGVWQRGHKEGTFIQRPSGEDVVARVWPGPCRFPDFLSAQVREWWGREQARAQALGVAGFWNDMNEPAVFDLPGKTLPGDCHHATDHGPRTHAQVHNVYGSAMAQASFDGARHHAPAERPFIISRAGYAGLQRHAVVWTGDNSSTWEHLADSIPMLLNLGLSGVPFCGADVGGFLDHANGELLARWTQLAAFTPFFRNHSNEGTHRQEPWAFGPEIEGICRAYITLRYQLRPYLYGLMAEAVAHGTPVMRPMAWHYQNDPEAVACGDQFLLGASFLVAPILRPGSNARSVYLPVGNWFDFWTGEFHTGRQHVIAHAPLATLPLYVRAGAVIPMTPPTPSVPEKNEAVITLQIWPGGAGEWDYYEDDGRTLDASPACSRRQRIHFLPQARGATLRWEAPRGAFPSHVKQWQVCLLRAPRAYRVLVAGQELDRDYDAATGTLLFALPARSDETCVRLR